MTHHSRRPRARVFILALGLVLGSLGVSAGVGTEAAQAATPGSFSPTGSMSVVRTGESLTLLPNGLVLVAGGEEGLTSRSPVTNSADLYDPVVGTWTPTQAMHFGRAFHTATLLGNGKVLVAGGLFAHAQAELYDPSTGTWALTGAMVDRLERHTATLLPSGEVLVAGGHVKNKFPSAAAELYDPVAGSWTSTGTMKLGRWDHTATLLGNGNVLVAGGKTHTDGSPTPTAELYNPALSTWAFTGSMSVARRGPTATLLADGTVLEANGQGFLVAGHFSTGRPSAETYDPSTGLWTKTGSTGHARMLAAAVLLPNGKVLVAGGQAHHSRGLLNTAELYDPATRSWSTTGSMTTVRGRFGAVLLPNGTVLVAGGNTKTAEIYTP
jgi:hypothetical protein